MMKTPPAWLRAFVRVAASLFPRAIVGFVFRRFWELGTPMRVRPDAAGVHSRARREILSIGNRSAVVYRWGAGPRTVLLVHGWRGRASQFAAVVEALESPERTIVAFDAPGNGDAPGDRTDLRDYLAVIEEIARDAGGLELLVGHSFGVMAVFVAVREGVRAKRLVSIAGIHDMDYTFATFSRAFDLPRRLAAALRRKIERDVFDGDTGIWQRFVSELDPTDPTPLLVIHDRDDRMIDLSQAGEIEGAHVGPTTRLITKGLGHTRVLSNAEVLRAVTEFVSSEARTR